MQESNSQNQTPHYYGDIVRILFVLGGLIMLIGLPVLRNYLTTPTSYSVIGIVVLILSAGVTNPKQVWHAGINTLIAVIAIAIFESNAVTAYNRYGGNDKFFLSNLVLGLIFLFAAYFSVKTFRGLILKNSNK